MSERSTSVEHSSLSGFVRETVAGEGPLSTPMDPRARTRESGIAPDRRATSVCGGSVRAERAGASQDSGWSGRERSESGRVIATPTVTVQGRPRTTPKGSSLAVSRLRFSGRSPLGASNRLLTSAGVRTAEDLRQDHRPLQWREAVEPGKWRSCLAFVRCQLPRFVGSQLFGSDTLA